MTLFGRKDWFAIEFAPIDDGNAQVPQCHFTYWIDNREIGNLDFEASVDDLLEEIRSFLVNRGKRKNRELFSLDTGEIIRVLASGLSSESTEWGDCAAHSITYSMGHGYPLESGRRYDVYVVENDERARIIAADSESDDLIVEKYIPAGEVDSVLMSAWDVMNK